ncbi:hypothetical protein DXG01_003534 [Tephrocybe rancida]|nr:hypothetical protein DXG01_003534 [Tephrocybe rancida]
MSRATETRTDTEISHQIGEATTSNTIALSPIELDVAKLQLTAAETRVQELERSLAEELEKIRQLKVAMAPHKRLPRELLGRVFAIASASNAGTTEYMAYVPSGKEVAWRLRSVCSSWREIALAEPDLWSTFEFFDGMISADDASRQRYLTFWRQNICHPSCLLFLKIVHGAQSGGRWEFVQEMIVAPNSRRIRHLAFISGAVEPAFLNMPAGSLPLLESLTINCRVNTMSWNRIASAMSLAETPRLHTLNLCVDTNEPSTRQIPTLQFDNITCLSLEPCTRSGSQEHPQLLPILQLLEGLRNLVDCTLALHGLSVEGVEEGICLPHLRRLRVTQTGPSYADEQFVLLFLRAPALATFELAIEKEHHIKKVGAILPFFAGSGCGALLTVRISLPHIRSYGAVPTFILGFFLATMMHVATFHLSGAALDELSLQMMLSGSLLPNVTELRLDVLSMDDIGTLVQIVMRREENCVTPGGSALPSLNSLDVVLYQRSVNLQCLEDYQRQAIAHKARLTVTHPPNFERPGSQPMMTLTLTVPVEFED